MRTNNNDTGSLFVGVFLPTQFQKQGIPTGLSVAIDGEEKPRVVTYVMGSVKKGWHVCCKGTGKFEEGEVHFSFVVAE